MTSIAPGEGTGNTIMVVDDTPANLRLLIGILAARGYQVRPATSGSHALAAAQANPPDLILLDITMPEMDGYTVCTALKADARTRQIPVIFISALDDVFDKVKAFAVGGVDYITKPFQAEEVHARVQTHLTIHQAQKDLQRLNQRLSGAVREQRALNRLNNILQRCQTPEEAYTLTAPFLSELFVGQAGALYRCHATTQHLESVGHWGDEAPIAAASIMSNCPAFLRGRAHLIEIAEEELGCNECLGSQRLPAMCIPLLTGGQWLGLLHVRGGPPASDESHEQWTQLTTMTADLLALALSNLKLRADLREQAIRDPLTGLFNRRFLNEMLTQFLHQATRHERPLAVVMLDIDHFKQINDNYGHDAGDMVLRILGQYLQASLRAGDIACRYGGEELILVLPEISLRDACQRADELRQTIRALQFEHDWEPLPMITVSLGVAGFPAHGHTPDDVIAAADRELYRAKAAGRDRVCCLEPPPERADACY
jgi:diguanylate cyclase (GGDEF)-like protein